MGKYDICFAVARLHRMIRTTSFAANDNGVLFSGVFAVVTALITAITSMIACRQGTDLWIDKVYELVPSFMPWKHGYGSLQSTYRR